MSVNLAACVTSFLIAFISLPVVIKYTLEKNLVDTPDSRKIHTKITPSLGGIAIFAGFLVAFLVWMDFIQWSVLRYVLASLFIVFLLGVRDDLVPFRAMHKLIGQIVAVVILLFSEIQINSFYGLLGVNSIPVYIGYPITAFTIIVITNSFNLIDGLDGLAGSVGLVALLAFGIWFYNVGDYNYSLMCFAMIGGILAFLVFNWEPSQIFMGDTGAMLIGMMLAILVIRFMGVNYLQPETSFWHYKGVISSAAAFIMLPLCDTVRIMIIRIARGQSPFSADKSHIHHRVMQLGISHSRSSLILLSVSALFILVSFVFRHIGDRIMIPVLIALAVALNLLLELRLRYKKAS